MELAAVLTILLAEHGHYVMATAVILTIPLVVCAYGWWNELRKKENYRKFSAMLEAHDSQNKVDFARVDDRLDKLREDMHSGFSDMRERMARLEGAFLRKEPD